MPDPTYDLLIERLRSQFPQNDAEISAAKTMYEQSMAPLKEPVSIPMKEQLATSIAAALPMLIGGLSGGTIGAGQGAQGTLLGMGQAVRSWEEDKERMQRARTMEAQKAAQLYMNALERAQRNQTAVARGEQQIGLHELGQEAADQRTMMNIAATNSRFNARLDASKEENAIDDFTAKALQDQLTAVGVKDADKIITPGMDASNASKIANSVRMLKVAAKQIEGSMPQALPAGTRAKVSDAIAKKIWVQRSLDKLSKVFIGNDPAKEYTWNEILTLLPAGERTMLMQDLNFGALQALYSDSGKQLNETEIKLYKNFFAGSGALAAKDIEGRLVDLLNAVNFKALTALRTDAGSPQYQQAALATARQYLGDLPGLEKAILGKEATDWLKGSESVQAQTTPSSAPTTPTGQPVGTVKVRTLQDGTRVKVQLRPDGKWEKVQ